MKSKQRGFGGLEVMAVVALWFAVVAINQPKPAEKKAETPATTSAEARS